jgi:hypothetical protein
MTLVYSCNQNEKVEHRESPQLILIDSDSIYFLRDSLGNLKYSIAIDMKESGVVFDQKDKLIQVDVGSGRTGFSLNNSPQFLVSYRDSSDKLFDRSPSFRRAKLRIGSEIVMPSSWHDLEINQDQVLAAFNDSSKHFSDYSISMVLIREKFDPSNPLPLVLDQMKESLQNRYGCTDLIPLKNLAGSQSVARGVRYANCYGVNDSEGLMYLFRRNKEVYSFSVLVKELKNSREFYDLIEFIVVQMNNQTEPTK